MTSQPISGHVFRFDGNRRPMWRAKYRLPDGRQVQKTLGPAWTARGRPPAGYWTRRTADAWLRRTLVDAVAGTLPGMVRTGATVADACAATFIAAVGDPRRFFTGRKLVAYLGLDPKVRQSGEAPARSGRISKRGSAAARWALVEAAWSVVLQPGPLHAFYDRTRARRGHGKAIVATARKLAVLFWCMLSRGEDYAHQQPSLTNKKLRRLEITAGAPKYARTARGIWSSNQAIRQAERQLAEQAEASYKRLVKDQQAGAPARKVGASATPERA